MCVAMVMTEEEILQNLAENCQEAGIYFQVFLQVPYLYIYINREAGCHIDYIQLMGKILTTIAALRIPDIQGISLHSRIFGTVEPDWETYLELPSHQSQTVEEPIEPSEQDYPIELETHYDYSPVVLEIETEPAAISLPVHLETEEALEIPENEEKIEAIPTPPENEPISTPAAEIEPANLPTESPAATPVEDEPFELSKYCFTRNRSLVTATLPHPSANITKIVDFFHVLPNKQFVISLLEDIFNASKTPNTANYPESIQNWIKDILELDGEKKRKASIWLSRYCINPTATMEQVKAVLTSVPAETQPPAKTQETEPQQTEETEQIEPSLLTPPKYKPSIQPERPPTSRPKKAATRKKSPSWQPSSVHLAIAWVIFTIFAVAINVRSMSAALETSPLCENSRFPEQCELVVQMAGAPAVELATKSHPGTPSERTKAAAEYEGGTADEYTPPFGLEESASRVCQLHGTIKAGMPFKEATKIMPQPISTEGQIVLPGVYLVDVQQHNFKGGSEPIRTACAFQYQEQTRKVNIDTLAIELIPTDWPEEAYQETSQPVALQKATGVFGTLSVLGTGTLFTAVGMFIASVLGLGMRASSLEAIFKASFFLGIIETLLSFIPTLFVAKIALETLALTLTSAVVKDFKVEWSMGYYVVALGAVVIMALRTLLNWMVFGLLIAWMS